MRPCACSTQSRSTASGPVSDVPWVSPDCAVVHLSCRVLLCRSYACMAACLQTSRTWMTSSALHAPLTCQTVGCCVTCCGQTQIRTYRWAAQASVGQHHLCTVAVVRAGCVPDRSADTCVARVSGGQLQRSQSKAASSGRCGNAHTGSGAGCLAQQAVAPCMNVVGYREDVSFSGSALNCNTD